MMYCSSCVKSFILAFALTILCTLSHSSLLRGYKEFLYLFADKSMASHQRSRKNRQFGRRTMVNDYFSNVALPPIPHRKLCGFTMGTRLKIRRGIRSDHFRRYFIRVSARILLLCLCVYFFFFSRNFNSNICRIQLTVDKDGHSYFATLEIKNVTVEDAGKYKVTAKNELGESNATISLNFDSKYLQLICPLVC